MRRERTRGKTSTFARAAAAAALVIPLAVVAAACGGAATAARQTPPPVRIGAIYNLTGGQASLDSPSLDGARLAVDRINARGGLLGRRVELLERDGQTNVTDVRLAAAGLVGLRLLRDHRPLGHRPGAGRRAGGGARRHPLRHQRGHLPAPADPGARLAVPRLLRRQRAGRGERAVRYRPARRADNGHRLRPRPRLHPPAGEVLRALVPRPGRQRTGHGGLQARR